MIYNDDSHIFIAIKSLQSINFYSPDFNYECRADFRISSINFTYRDSEIYEAEYKIPKKSLSRSHLV